MNPNIYKLTIIMIFFASYSDHSPLIEVSNYQEIDYAREVTLRSDKILGIDVLIIDFATIADIAHQLDSILNILPDAQQEEATSEAVQPLVVLNGQVLYNAVLSEGDLSNSNHG